MREVGLLDTPHEERYDRVTRIARRLFDVPTALVSLVDEDRQWFKSRQGLDVAETPRKLSFCGHAILGDDLFVVADALLDARFHDNPYVTGKPGIRFYAGCPLKLPNGAKVGTLCIIDKQPRALSSEDEAMLRDLAAIVESEFAAMLLATEDELTRIANRRGFEHLSSKTLEICRRLANPAYLLYFDLDGFKQINDHFGHAEGDRTLAEFAAALSSAFRKSDVLGRIGGDEFAAFAANITERGIDSAIARLKTILHERKALSGRSYDIRFSVGHVAFDPEQHANVTHLMNAADQLMFTMKRQRKSAAGSN